MSTPDFELRLAENEADLIAAQRLRYDVFVRELGGDGALVDHKAGLERDAFDPYYDHLLLIDRAREDVSVVGVYRLLRGDRLGEEGGPDRFYSEAEYDLTRLKSSGRRLLELGRSCLHKDYRGGTALMQLWAGLASYVQQHEIDILFGVASFHGTDISALAPSLSLLHHRHFAPANIRVRARDEVYQSMNLLSEDQIDRATAMRAVPALIKGYLRLGGVVGDGAFIDNAFNTTDICLILDMARMNEKQRDLYTRDMR